MTLDIELYRSRLTAYNAEGKDSQVNSMKSQIINGFSKNPSYFSVLINGVERDVHIVSDNNNQYKLLCKPNEVIGVGDCVAWSGGVFLCTSVDEDISVQSKGILQKTNFDLKWITSSDNLVTRNAITSAQTLYTTGIKDENVLRVPDGMQGIQLPYDDETKKLSRGDCFVFNKTKYEITFYDRTTHPGLLVLICKETSISDVFDDLENEIADRYRADGSDRLSESSPIEPEIPEEPVDPTEPPSEDSFTIQIVGADRFGLMTESTYTAKVLNNGVEVDGEVTFSVNNTLANIKSQSNNICVLETNRQFKTGTFTLRAELLDDNLIFDEKNIIITGL